MKKSPHLVKLTTVSQAKVKNQRRTSKNGQSKPITYQMEFVNEYGKGGQPARPFISAANIQSETAVRDAMAEVWGKAGNG